MPCRALLQAPLSARGAKTTSRLKVCVWLPHNSEPVLLLPVISYTQLRLRQY